MKKKKIKIKKLKKCFSGFHCEIGSLSMCLRLETENIFAKKRQKSEQ